MASRLGAYFSYKWLLPDPYAFLMAALITLCPHHLLSEFGLLRDRDRDRVRSWLIRTSRQYFGSLNIHLPEVLEQKPFGNINALLPPSGQNVFCVTHFCHLISVKRIWEAKFLSDQQSHFPCGNKRGQNFITLEKLFKDVHIYLYMSIYIAYKLIIWKC